MKYQSLYQMLEKLQNQEISLDEALQSLRSLPYEDIEYAKVDHHRTLRKGFPEVIYCQGKTAAQIKGIMEKLTSFPGNILATRAQSHIFHEIQQVFPEALYHELSQTIVIQRDNTVYGSGNILVVAAGTSDLPVAEEAAVTARVMGNEVEQITDVGVAGIHRLFDNTEKLFQAQVIVVVAGMEGALASVVSGLVNCPVIAVPTSVGYGASFGGLAPLLTMLNSCAPGVSVVNIDNGFGAGYTASLINRR